jgi:hypothetical protein
MHYQAPIQQLTLKENRLSFPPFIGMGGIALRQALLPPSADLVIDTNDQ